REFAACANVGLAVGDDLFAIASNKSGPWRCQRASDATTARSNCKGSLPATTRNTSTAKIHAADISRAHRGVPGGSDLAILDEVGPGHGVDDVGIGDTGDGPILVVEYRIRVGGIAPIVIAPPVVALRGREVHGFGFDEG